MIQRRFNGCGETNFRAKLTQAERDEILANPDGLTRAQLAERYGVTPNHISRLRHGHRYAKAPIDRNYNATLHPEDLPLMETFRTAGYKLAEIGRKFGVSEPAVSQALNRVTWKEIPRNATEAVGSK